MATPEVAACVADALADLERQGQLSLEDVQRLIDGHRLTGGQSAAVFSELRVLGIQVASSTAEEAAPAQLGVQDAKGDALGVMLRNAGRAKLLTAAEEVALGRRIAVGQRAATESADALPDSDLGRIIADGKRAHQQLVLANIRLVVSIARRYTSQGMELTDLIQEGTLGVMRAADKFDHSMGFKFSTYATWWIRQAITRSLADKGRLIRLPVHVDEKLRRVRGERARLRAELERDPSLAELAAALDSDPGEVKAILDWARDPVSLDMSVGEDDDVDLGSLLNLYAEDVEDVVANRATIREVHTALARFEQHQQATSKGAMASGVAMLRLRFGLEDGEEKTLDEIGARFGVTRERARQILNKTLSNPVLTSALGPARGLIFESEEGTDD